MCTRCLLLVHLHGLPERLQSLKPTRTHGLETIWCPNWCLIGTWLLEKRGFKGNYHHVSVKHLGRYVDEYAFRLNEGACNNHTMNRIAAMLLGAQGKRLTFDDLTAD